MKEKHYWIKMIGFFLLDFALAAGIVYGYYWVTFKQTKAPVTNQVVIRPPEGSQTQEASDISDETETGGTAVASETDGSGLEGGTESSDSGDDGSERADAENDDVTETEEPTLTELPDIEYLTWTEKFLEHFSEVPVMTDTQYSDEHISVTVTTYTQGKGSGKITYYVADIYVAAIEYFRTGIYADDGTFQWTTTPQQYALENPMDILITNGDYCGYSQQGLIIRNGRVYREADSDVELCVLRYDGTMEIYEPNTYTLDMAVEQGAWQTWCFGPSLLDENGNAKDSFLINDYLKKAHPRTALGYYEPGHYCLLVVDGREEGYSRGMTMAELAQTFEELGCQAAYNLDGGGSSCMLFQGNDVNHTTERYLSDFIVVTNQLPE